MRMRCAGLLTEARIRTHVYNMYHLLLFQGNSGYANAPQYYVIRAFPVSLCLWTLFTGYRTRLFGKRNCPTVITQDNNNNKHNVTIYNLQLKCYNSKVYRPSSGHVEGLHIYCMYKTLILFNLIRILRCYTACRLQRRHKFDEVLQLQRLAEAAAILHHTQAASVLWTMTITRTVQTSVFAIAHRVTHRKTCN